MNKGYCIICGKPILPGEETLWTKPKGYKTRWFHKECFKQIQQKYEKSPKKIDS